MMGHPLEAFRIFPILAISVLLGFTAQAYGIFAGSFVEIKVNILTIINDFIIFLKYFFLSVDCFVCGLAYALSNFICWWACLYERCECLVASIF